MFAPLVLKDSLDPTDPDLAIRLFQALSQGFGSRKVDDEFEPSCTSFSTSFHDIPRLDHSGATLCRPTTLRQRGRTRRTSCVRTALSAAAPVNPNLSYTYRSDQELVQASQTASAYCQKYGSQPMTSSMANNPDGTRTVTFQCGSR